MYQPVGLVAVLNTEIAGDLGTEVVGVGSYSVHAVVRGRNHHGQHLPPPAAERGGAVHQRAIEIQRSLHGGGVGAHDGDNTPDPSGAGHCGVVQLLQRQNGSSCHTKLLILAPRDCRGIKRNSQAKNNLHGWKGCTG